jgi:3-deoxy-7-phosphoheptulonate synthase
MSLAAVASGADGLMLEVHTHPEIAMSDKDQALTPKQFSKVAKKVRALHAFLDNLN